MRVLGEKIGKYYRWASGKEKQNYAKNAKDGEIAGYASCSGAQASIKCQTRSRESRNRVKLAVSPTESGLLLTEEVTRALVGVIRVDDGSADRVLLRVRQVTRDAVRVAEVVLRIPIWCSAQTTRRATAVISMRAASAMAGRTARSAWWAAILTAGRLMNPVTDSIPVGIVGRIRPVDMILDHARGCVPCLELPGSGCMRILTPGDHAGRSAATGGHRQTQQRSSNHHPNWHGSPRQSDSSVPCFVSTSAGLAVPAERLAVCLSVIHSLQHEYSIWNADPLPQVSSIHVAESDCSA